MLKDSRGRLLKGSEGAGRKARPLRSTCAFSHLYLRTLPTVSTTAPIGEFTEPSPRSYRITIRCPEYEFTRIKALGSSVASELDVFTSSSRKNSVLRLVSPARRDFFRT